MHFAFLRPRLLRIPVKVVNEWMLFDCVYFAAVPPQSILCRVCSAVVIAVCYVACILTLPISACFVLKVFISQSSNQSGFIQTENVHSKYVIIIKATNSGKKADVKTYIVLRCFENLQHFCFSHPFQYCPLLVLLRKHLSQRCPTGGTWLVASGLPGVSTRPAKSP